MNVETDTTSRLGNHCASLERLVNTLDRVLLDFDQEARRQLRARGAGVEERRRSVGKVLLRHVVVGLDGGGNVVLVDSDGDPERLARRGALSVPRNTSTKSLPNEPHEHVLRTFGNLAVNLEEVRALERLETAVEEKQERKSIWVSTDTLPCDRMRPKTTHKYW